MEHLNCAEEEGNDLRAPGHLSKDWLAHNQDNMFGWSDISTHGLLFQ